MTAPKAAHPDNNNAIEPSAEVPPPTACAATLTAAEIEPTKAPRIRAIVAPRELMLKWYKDQDGERRAAQGEAQSSTFAIPALRQHLSVRLTQTSARASWNRRPKFVLDSPFGANDNDALDQPHVGARHRSDRPLPDGSFSSYNYEQLLDCPTFPRPAPRCSTAPRLSKAAFPRAIAKRYLDDRHVTFFIVLEIGGCGRQNWYDFVPLSSMIRGWCRQVWWLRWTADRDRAADREQVSL